MDLVREATVGDSDFGAVRSRFSAWIKVSLSIFLVIGGLLLNEIPWYSFPSRANDPWFPIVSFFLTVTGAAYLLDGLLQMSGRSGIIRAHVSGLRTQMVILSVVWLISIPSTAAFGVFYAGMRFMQTGADRTGQCEGLYHVAGLTGLIPKSVVSPSKPAIGCGSERYGMFLSQYNNVTIFGVNDKVEQDRILNALSDYRVSDRISPIRVSFYEKENWSVSTLPSGVVLQTRLPEKLVRVATVR